MQKRIVSGMRPTGKMHIGNLFGALKNWVKLQDTYECFFMVADYHSLTTPTDISKIRTNTLDMVIDWLATGIDPKKSTIFIQSQVPQHAELALLLGMFTPLGRLLRCPTYKEQIREYPDFQNYGLLGYPVLQAADILIYKATGVPVGEDQRAHVEIAREIARIFNHKFGKTFVEPQTLLSETPKIMGLNRPTEKMSKSFGEENCIYLTDSPEVISKKIKKAVTDIGPSNKMSAGVANLFQLMQLFSDSKTLEEFKIRYKNGTIKYQEMKEVLANDIANQLKPIREKRTKLQQKTDYIYKILEEGRIKASKIAQETVKEVKEKLGL